MSRRNPTRVKRQNLITIPKGVGPHVKLVFAEMHRQRITYDEVEEGSGVLRTTLKAWRTKNKPGLESMEAVFGFLGFDFVPVPRSKVLPPEVVAELEPVARRLVLTMPQAIETLCGLVLGIHENVKAPRRAKPRPPDAVRRRASAHPHPNQPAFLGFTHEAPVSTHSTVH